MRCTLAKYRSREVVEAELQPDGQYLLVRPSGFRDLVPKKLFEKQYQLISRVLDWNSNDGTDPGPGRLYDGDGHEIPALVTRVDLDTGEYWYFLPDAEGNPNPHLPKEKGQAKLPIKFVPA